MKVPNGDKAVIDLRKLEEYCLNADHEVGGHKARVFASALNLTPENAPQLSNALLKAVLSEEAKPGPVNKHGLKFIVDFDMWNEGRVARVRSVWIIDNGEENPRLVTCLVI